MKFRLRFMVVVGTLATAGACGSQEVEPPPERSSPLGVYGVAPAAVGGTPSVITLMPAVPPTGGGTEGGDLPTIDQLGLVFTPTTLVARVGDTVVFTNSETINHNVHVTFTDSDSTVLNVETDPGARAEFIFDIPGGYDVTCDHHPGMRAFIYATDAPYTVFADNAGAFVIPDVPPGRYALEVWSVDPRLRTRRDVEVSGPSTQVSPIP